MSVNIALLLPLIFRAFGNSVQKIHQASHDARQVSMWHKDQKTVSALVLAIVKEAQTP